MGEAAVMNAMATAKQHDRVATVEDKLIFAANGADRLQALLDSAGMGVLDVDGEANVALVTVPIVDAETFPDAAEAAFVAVVDGLVGIVCP